MTKLASNIRLTSLLLRSCSCLLLIASTQMAVATEFSDPLQQQIRTADVEQQGFYLGAKAGVASYVDSCITQGVSCSDTTFGYGLFGGYTFDQLFSIELSVNDYGSPQARGNMSNVDVNVRGAEVGVRFALPKLWRLAPYFRVGTHYIDSEQTLHSPEGISRFGYNGWRPSLALGLTYPLAKRWDLQLEYQYVNDIGSSETIESDLGFLSLGVSYRFGQPSWGGISDKTISDADMDGEFELISLDTLKDQSTPAIDSTSNALERHFKYIQKFSYDSYQLEGRQQFEKWLVTLPNEPVDIIVIGHTDSIGNAAYNQLLSERRAKAVEKMITEAFKQRHKKINSMIIQGMGELVPTDVNDTADGQASNRRVEIFVIYKQDVEQ